MSVRGLRRRRLRRPRPGGVQAALTEQMVDRLMWRTGFGPSDADRKRWTGKTLPQVVNQLLKAPQGPFVGDPPLRDKSGLNPHEDDRDLVLAWLDRMVRTRNPLVERLTFFWHGHFATQRDEVSPPQLMTRQNELFRRYSDLAAFPTANYRTMVFEVGEDPAMLRFLNGEESTEDRVNENYPREVMELFCLGPLAPNGQPNYNEADVLELSKALTGWQIDDDNPDQTFGYFNKSRWFSGNKTVLGQTGDYEHRDAVDVVLKHPSHPQFLMRKLWAEFIPTEPDRATLKELVAVYKKSRFRLKPVLRKILTHPDMLDSVKEPNMIKPPVVFAVGLMRSLGLTITDDTLYNSLNEMGQLPYFPPTVAGWEGGTAWLNTNTALARFALVNELLDKAYEKSDNTDDDPDDVVEETAAQAYKRAHEAVGRPWVARGTRSALMYYANNAPVKRKSDRVARQRVLRAFMLGGPDAQVM